MLSLKGLDNFNLKRSAAVSMVLNPSSSSIKFIIIITVENPIDPTSIEFTLSGIDWIKIKIKVKTVW